MERTDRIRFIPPDSRRESVRICRRHDFASYGGLWGDPSDVYPSNENGYNIVGFRVATIPDLPGDFNHDGTVDAADYVVWRKNPAASTRQTTTTPGAPTSATPLHGSGSGASANAAVPEPATLVLLMLAAAGWCLRRGRAA